LTHFSKTLTLAISFELQVIGFSNFICLFLMTRPSCWYQMFFTLWPWPWSLTHFSKNLTLALSFEWQVIGLSHFICVFLMTRPSYWYNFYAPVSKDRGHIVFGLSVCLSVCLSAKTLTLAISFER
jgi:hypothetical protein